MLLRSNCVNSVSDLYSVVEIKLLHCCCCGCAVPVLITERCRLVGHCSVLILILWPFEQMSKKIILCVALGATVCTTSGFIRGIPSARRDYRWASSGRLSSRYLWRRQENLGLSTFEKLRWSWVGFRHGFSEGFLEPASTIVYSTYQFKRFICEKL